MFIIVRSYDVPSRTDGTLDRLMSETPFETKEAADAYIREMVELNPGVELDFFVKEV